MLLLWIPSKAPNSTQNLGLGSMISKILSMTPSSPCWENTLRWAARRSTAACGLVSSATAIRPSNELDRQIMSSAVGTVQVEYAIFIRV